MQQHERPSGHRHGHVRPSRRPRLRLALATAADGTHAPRADFNGDGIDDVAFSAPGTYVNGKKDAGQLVVRYGTTTGVSSAKRSAISRNTTGNPGTAASGVSPTGHPTFGADFAD
ncbi:FG-GAP repeat protein [Streptomyces chartreusis]|uniref:FG-GAP repeat n=1 Tax=Streptomyces chartreusis NRRL 3882 TaxID=1079985 RepID=A0A2N9BA98_STRCX|nr:hypothetical protein [Streptomyces sp. SID5464]SOR80274.1 hypothetical protein SCNRRL3882_3729 [Streptomyces chartreusis NRRL 3882]